MGDQGDPPTCPQLSQNWHQPEKRTPEPAFLGIEIK